MNVELYESRYVQDTVDRMDMAQKEDGRCMEWVKYDEDQQSISKNRYYSTNRILNLRFQMLVTIRKLFTKGVILLDVDEATFMQNLSKLLDEMVFESESRETLKKEICRLNEIDTIFRQSSQNSLTSLVTIDPAIKDNERVMVKNKYNCSNPYDCVINICTRLCHQLKIRQRNGKNPESENQAKIFLTSLSNISSKPRLILTRLANDSYSSDECPTKIVIFIIGSSRIDFSYKKLGQCLVDILLNTTFQDVIKRAKTPEMLLFSVERFFDNAVVVPLAHLDGVDAINFPRLRRALAGDTLEIRKHKNQKRTHEKSNHHVAHHTYDPLVRTGKLFNGLMYDIRKRYSSYWSDIFDAFHYKCLVSTILIFFITFATAIGLGEILRSKTDGLMGLSETLVSMCVCGVIWGLFSGQPLIIQTKTAAFVIIEGGLYAFCQSHGLNFMVVRVWTGVWVLPITIILVAFEAPILIRYVTRFTEEAIDTLISMVLIFESLQFLIDTFSDNPLYDSKDYCDPAIMNNTLDHKYDIDEHSLRVDQTKLLSMTGNDTDFILELHNQPNTALLTLVLMISTFFLSLYLERLKQSSYFSHTVRKAIGNFSIPITIPLMSMVTNIFFNVTYVHKLDMPTQFSPTRPLLRGWFINPFDTSLHTGFPVWAIFASLFPAFILTILIFVELELAEHELHRQERGLRKGSGFHLDLVLSGILMLVCGFLGVPWLGAGCVESFSHANALTVHKKMGIYDESKVEYVVEQRVTTILVALLQGACAFLGQYLRNIPVAVLMGIFVHLSITNLTLIQFVHRIVLYIVPRKYYPDKAYCQNVSMWKMHLYTTIQLICFAVLFGVEVVAKICILFPLVAGIIALIRYWLLPRVFTHNELLVLDSGGDADDEEIYAGTIRRKSINP